MFNIWSEWKAFPDPKTGGELLAPVGPGLFELRDTETGKQIAFDCSANVARSLAVYAPQERRSLFRLFGGEAGPQGRAEYRTCATSDLRVARLMMRHLHERRGSCLRRRMAA